jgi:hypothetical protein
MPEVERLKLMKRFMECDDGRRFLEGIRGHLKGHTIDEVTFVNSEESITTILRLSNGQLYAFNDEELFFETLREQFTGLFRELTRQDTLVRKGEEHDE